MIMGERPPYRVPHTGGGDPPAAQQPPRARAFDERHVQVLVEVAADADDRPAGGQCLVAAP
jgi:hypothetical protein